LANNRKQQALIMLRKLGLDVATLIVRVTCGCGVG